MKLRLLLQIKDGRTIPVNYQYPISAVVYRILDSADQDYAAFLHDTGYKKVNSLKSFKFFTFSDIKAPLKLQGDRLHLLTPDAELEVSFHLPHAAEKFIRGIFLQQQIIIADKRSCATRIQEVILQIKSSVVCGLKNKKKNYDFLSHEHPQFTSQLIYNWKEKYTAIYGTEMVDEAFADSAMDVIFYKNPPKSRLIIIKADTAAETKIRGFVNFQLKVRGKREAVELLLNAGVGLYNSTIGGGYVLLKQKKAS